MVRLYGFLRLHFCPLAIRNHHRDHLVVVEKNAERNVKNTRTPKGALFLFYNFP